MRTIEFFSSISGLSDAFPIVPAKGFRPKWMAQAKEDYVKVLKERNDKFSHIYQCPGIFEIYRHGFIVPMWLDVIITTDPRRQGFSYKTPTNDFHQDGKILIDKHDGPAVRHLPMPPYSEPYVVKINTPWNIVAPKGVKFLMLPISYPDSFEFANVPGILDPSVSCEVNFQLYWNVKEGETVIKAGTPMVHMIPLCEGDFDIICRTMNDNDEKWLAKRKYLNNFSFRPKRNLIKDLYNKHFGGK